MKQLSTVVGFDLGTQEVAVAYIKRSVARLILPTDIVMNGYMEYGVI